MTMSQRTITAQTASTAVVRIVLAFAVIALASCGALMEPKKAGKDFLAAVSAGDSKAAHLMCVPSVAYNDIDQLVVMFSGDLEGLKDSTFNHISRSNAVTNISGTIESAHGATLQMEMQLIDTDGGNLVSKFNLPTARPSLSTKRMAEVKYAANDFATAMFIKRNKASVEAMCHPDLPDKFGKVYEALDAAGSVSSVSLDDPAISAKRVEFTGQAQRTGGKSELDVTVGVERLGGKWAVSFVRFDEAKK